MRLNVKSGFFYALKKKKVGTNDVCQERGAMCFSRSLPSSQLNHDILTQMSQRSSRAACAFPSTNANVCSVNIRVD